MWPFTKQELTEEFETWPIFRTTKEGKKYGLSTQLFINNMQCHFAGIDVYEDGMIDCWELVDYPLFQEKINSHWVVPQPNKNQQLFVYNFGATTPTDAVWYANIPQILKFVKDTIKALNPTGVGLTKMPREEPEFMGRVKVIEMPLVKSYRATANGDVVGDSVPILVSDEDFFLLSKLMVYTDGLVQVGREGELVEIAKLADLFSSGVIATIAPPGSRIKLPGLGHFSVTEQFGWVTSDDRIAEIHDKLNQLCGKQDSADICIESFHQFIDDPSDENREALRVAYEAVPEHLRMYLGDMDVKDGLILDILDGNDDEVFEYLKRNPM
jgi:hypothetical protein